MNSLLNFLVSRWALFFLASSAVILGAAYFFQFVLGYQPCELCLYQRYPYMIIVVVSLLAFLLRHKTDISSKRAARGLLVIIVALLILDAFIAGHHIGVEQGYWKAFTSCAGIEFDPSASSEELLRFLQESQPVLCDQRRTFLGISFAEYNLVFASLLTAFGIYTVRKTR